jgi:hypothetical protein
MTDCAVPVPDPQMESFVQTMEKNNVSRMLNDAYDRQTFFEQKHNIITQKPKVGHVFEVEYKQTLKPPSYVTANHTDYDIISNQKYHDHHWAPEGRRPPRIPTPERKPPFLTAVNKPRDFNITTNMYKEHHAERTKFDAEQTRAMVLDTFSKTRDFDCVKVQYCDENKEALYQENRRKELLNRGKDHYKKFPPTYQTSEATVYNITSHEVKDAERLAQIQERERRQWETKAADHLGRDEVSKIYQHSVADTEMGRKVNRIAHQR